MTIKLLTPMVEGLKAEFEVDGKTIARRVYYNSSCGTFVLIKGYKIFAYDFFTEDTFKLEV